MAAVSDTVVLILGFDGEPVPYTKIDGMYIGPCPACFARQRFNESAEAAALSATSIRFPAGEPEHAGSLAMRRDGTYKRAAAYAAKHVGCFEGKVIETSLGLAWHRAPGYKDLGLYWSR